MSVKENVSIRINTDLKNRITKLAKLEDRSFSSYMSRVIVQHLKEKETINDKD